MSNNKMLYSLKIGTAITKIIPRRIVMLFTKYLVSLFSLIPTEMLKNIMNVQGIISPELNASELKLRARKVLNYYAQYWVDVFWISSNRSSKDISEIINVEGKNYYDNAVIKALKNNSGVILALGHLGNFELAGAWLGTTDTIPLVVAERLKPPELFNLFTKSREVAGMEVIAHDDNPTKKLITGLKLGRTICLVADRDISKNGQIHKFFDRDKSMPQGPATLSYLTGAVIVPVATYLNHDFTLTIVFYPECELQKGDNKKEIIYNTSKKLFEDFEEMILRDPSQYHVLQNEWE